MNQLGIVRQDARDFLLSLSKTDDPLDPRTTAKIGEMVPTCTGKGRDREVTRDMIATPLVNLGILEKVTLPKKKGQPIITMGHPINNSPHCAYRLTRAFWNALSSCRAVEAWLSSNARRQERVSTRAIFASADRSSHEQLIDACIDHFARLHLGPTYSVIYRDPSHGPRVELDSLLTLGAAGLSMDPSSDPCPDLIFWNEHTHDLCVVEAVMTEGIIDDRRRAALDTWIATCRGSLEVTYVTAFCTWKTAATFMATLAKNSKCWVQESPFVVWSAEPQTQQCLPQT